MSYIGTYDGKIFHNPSNKFCIVIIKTADTSIPEQARDKRRYKDHLIRFTAVGYEIPMTDAVELELEGEWVNGKYGMQLQVEQWREIVPKTKEGVLSYLGSGLIKGIGEKTAAEIVAKFGTNTLDILEKHPERLLEVRGITENKLEDIRTSFAESRMLRDIMTLLAPFKLTPKTALKIYQHFGPACLDILKKSPFELCQIPGFGFRRVDAIVRKTDDRPRDPMRIRGALHCTLDEAKGKQGHLFLEREDLCKAAFKMLNEKIPLPEMRVRTEEVGRELDAMILSGSVVCMKDSIYHPAAFAQEDETASRIARLLAEERPPMKDEKFKASITQSREDGMQIKMLSLEESGRPKIEFQSRRNLKAVAETKALRKKLGKFLADHFLRWKGSRQITVYDDFEPYSFFFQEQTPYGNGICGGVILHGRENLEKAYYGIHT